MSTYVLMRFLESAPQRYERGMRVLTFGRIDRAYESLAGQVEAGQRVLDIGCGTGALTRRIARRGARVRGIDINADMLEVAGRRVVDEGLEECVELIEEGVAELDAEADSSYDVVVSGLCFSELSEDELAFALGQVARVLKPGGRLLVADEIRPRSLVLRVLHAIVRIPLAAATYLLTRQTTHALRQLPAALTAAGFHVVSQSASALGTFGVFVAEQTQMPAS